MRLILSICFVLVITNVSATTTDSANRLRTDIMYTYGFPLGKYPVANGNPSLQPRRNWGIGVGVSYMISRRLALGAEICGTAYKIDMAQLGRFYSSYAKSGYYTHAEIGGDYTEYNLTLESYSATASYIYQAGIFELRPFIQFGFGRLYPSTYNIYRKKYGENYSDRASSGWQARPFFYPGIGASANIAICSWLDASIGARCSRGTYRYTFTETTTDFLNNRSIYSYSSALPISIFQLQAGLQVRVLDNHPFKKK